MLFYFSIFLNLSCSCNQLLVFVFLLSCRFSFSRRFRFETLLTPVVISLHISAAYFPLATLQVFDSVCKSFNNSLFMNIKQFFQLSHSKNFIHNFVSPCAYLVVFVFFYRNFWNLSTINEFEFRISNIDNGTLLLVNKSFSIVQKLVVNFKLVISYLNSVILKLI